MSQQSEESKLGDHRIIRERLELIYREKRQYLRAKARGFGVRAGDEDDAIHEAYLALLNLKPRDPDSDEENPAPPNPKPRKGIRELLDHWESTPENLERLDDALTALFVTYLRFKCLDWLRKHSKDQPLEEEAISELLARLDLKVTLAWIDRLVNKMHSNGELTKMEWEYWHWRRANPDGGVEDFARSLDPPRQPGGWITRSERSLFEKIADKVAAHLPRQARQEQNVEERNKGVGRTLSGGRSQQERRWL